MPNSEDERWMRLCLALAERGAGRVSPNPLVGCVIARNGRKIAEGWHESFGAPHAERIALRKAGSRAQGATLYANLEPCCHWGKTPPCTDAVIQAGIKRVVAAIKDPNPLVAGQGLARLQRHDIAVSVGVLSAEAAHINRAFMKWIRTGTPYVTLKTAMTLDGKICTKTGASRWISSPESRTWVHQMRARVDAVMVGARTARRDHPSLTSHGQGRNPLRIIVKGRANLKEFLQKLGQRNVSHVLVEGGGTLNASLIKNRLVDELIFFVAPKIFGGESALTPVEGQGISRPGQAWNLRWDLCTRIGNDLMIRAYPAR
jgi:diaminohydroxyphosphoribosylaminopyrimidine deaminase/5-amino-6-(5-phosphoribosylamino)uracil reductase